METPEKQLFGTNGVRGIIGEQMNPELVMKIGRKKSASALPQN